MSYFSRNCPWTLAITAVAIAGRIGTAAAQVTPVSVTAKAGAYAHVDPTPFGTMTYDEYFGSLGPFNLSEHQFEEIPGGHSCDVLATCIGGVNAGGASGSATMQINWIATDPAPGGNPPHSGTFGGNGYFRYSFMLASPATLSVTVTTTSNTSGAAEQILNAMAINHSLGVNNQFTEVPVVGVTQQNYPLAAGFHILLMEHYPNLGVSPWPTTNVFAQTVIDFQIYAPAGNGDLNCSGSLTVADIQPMVLALTDPVQYSANFNCQQNGDMNGDGQVNGRDLQLFVDALVP